MIRLDLNKPEFQANLLAPYKPKAWAVLKTPRLLKVMNLEQRYFLRSSSSWRTVAWRDGHSLRLLSLHQDHNSAYN